MFETEDQRNWTDASFKTFCTPLSKPFPALLKKGETISQTITFSITPGHSHQMHTRETIELKETETTFRIPNIGVGSSTEMPVLTPAIANKLTDVKFSHYRIELDCKRPEWSSLFEKEAQNANILKLPLEIVFLTTSNYKLEIDALLKLLKNDHAKTATILFLSAGSLVTDQGLIDHVSEIKNLFGGIKLGAGTNFNFTEVNQNRFNPSSMDFISFSIDPQEHTFDDMSIIENIEAQAHVIESARKIYPYKQIHVCPLTLKKRNNPYTKDPNAVVMSEDQRMDPRQSEKFCAVFTLGSIKALSMSGCASVTYYQTVGKQGIVSSDGKAFPVFEALKDVLNGSSSTQEVISTSPMDVDAMVLVNGAKKSILVWNYTDETKRVIFNGKTFSLSPKEILVNAI
jgi:hypothetical protein